MSEPTLNYAHGESARNNADDWPSRRFFVIALFLSLLPQVVGIGLAVAFVSTKDEVFAIFGLPWLVIGEILTLFAVVSALVYRASIGGNRPNDRAKRFKAALLVTLSLLNIPVAAWCVVKGLLIVQ